MEKKISKNQRVYPHHFGCSQNGGGTFFDFLIFFSPWLYLLITTSSSLKAVEQYPKSSPKVAQNHHFGLPFLSPWVSWRIFTFGSGLWGSYQRYDKNMGSFCDFGCVRVCHTQPANHVKYIHNILQKNNLFFLGKSLLVIFVFLLLACYVPFDNDGSHNCHIPKY